MTNKEKELNAKSTETLEENVYALELCIFETGCQLESEYALEGLGKEHIEKTDKDFDLEDELSLMKKILKERYALQGLNEFGQKPRTLEDQELPF